MENITIEINVCQHKFIHRETTRRTEEDGRGYSRCLTWVQVDTYFCEKCLEEKEIKKEWCGQHHYSDRPDWTKQGDWKRMVN